MRSTLACFDSYFGDCICYAPHEVRTNYTYNCIPTIGSQIAAANHGGKTTVEQGVDVLGPMRQGIPAALAAVDKARKIRCYCSNKNTV